jgi:opacity protein-like surface antigen
MPRIGRLPVVALLSAVLCLTGAASASAAPPDKAAVLSRWTQTSAASYSAWNGARNDQGAWSAYAFDWSTDYCSSSPDKPLGFDFKLSCYRHDFGYRNYKAAGRFDANKPRLDDAFYADLSRKCDTYNAVVRPACDALAWIYYEAVREFGYAAISQADLNRVARMKAAAESRAAVNS